MIESIRIRDFRGIHAAMVEGLGSMNVLVGPNNSGKTALLEAIYLACTSGRKVSAQFDQTYVNAQLASPDFFQEQPIARIWMKHLHPTSRRSPIKVVPASSTVDPLALHIKGSSKDAPFRLLKLTPHDESTVEDWPEATLQHIVFFGTDLNPMDVVESQVVKAIVGADAPSSSTPIRLVYFWDRSLTYHYVGQASWYLTGSMPAPQHTFFYDAQNTLAHLPTEFYTRMLSVVPGWPQKIAERFARVLRIEGPFNVLFMPTGVEKEWMQGQIAPADRPALPIDDFGDGARAVFKVLAPLIALSELVTKDMPGIFLWEEPELFQNPLTLGRLLAEVADLAEKKPVQVFIATHSLEVIAHLVTLVERGLFPESALRTLRTHLHKGELTASIFSTKDVLRWTDMHLDVRVPDGVTESPLRFEMDGDSGAAGHRGGGDE